MKWCEIFRTGRHKDSKGIEKDWTKQDLETIRNNFYNVNPDFPICCGHPKSNSPAYGWVKDLKIEDEPEKKCTGLFASFKEVAPEFAEACKKGLFKTRSISLTQDLIPRHLAFLGAQTPAVKGLEQFCFAAPAEDITIDFSDTDAFIPIDNSVKLGGLTPFIGEKKTEHVETNYEPAFSFECSKNDDIKNNRLAKAGGAAGSPKIPAVKTKKEVTMTEEELAAQISSKDEEIAALKKQINESKEAALSKEFSDFCDSAIDAGNILPAQKDDVLNILFACKDNTINFSDGGETSAAESVKRFVKSLKQIDLSPVADPKNVQQDNTINFSDSEDVKNNILAIQKEYEQKGITLTAVQAYDKLSK